MFDASEQILKLKSTFSSSLMKIRNHENIKYHGAICFHWSLEKGAYNLMTNDYIHNDLTTQHFFFTFYFVIYGQP